MKTKWKFHYVIFIDSFVLIDEWHVSQATFDHWTHPFSFIWFCGCLFVCACCVNVYGCATMPLQCACKRASQYVLYTNTQQLRYIIILTFKFCSRDFSGKGEIFIVCKCVLSLYHQCVLIYLAASIKKQYWFANTRCSSKANKILPIKLWNREKNKYTHAHKKAPHLIRRI